MSANGMPNESTTWLRISVRAGFSPMPMTMIAGSMVATRRSISGTL
jgi:hypothetical protein